MPPTHALLSHSLRSLATQSALVLGAMAFTGRLERVVAVLASPDGALPRLHELVAERELPRASCMKAQA